MDVADEESWKFAYNRWELSADTYTHNEDCPDLPQIKRKYTLVKWRTCAHEKTYLGKALEMQGNQELLERVIYHTTHTPGKF